LKRPILIAVIGYIIGIIVGLYFKTSIVFFYIPLIAIYLVYIKMIKQKPRKCKILSIRRYIRYLKIYLNFQVIILVIISSIISNIIVIKKDIRYERIYIDLSKIEKVYFTGVIVSDKEEKEFYNKYKIQVEYHKKKVKFYITTNKSQDLKYGDKITFSGTYKKPEIQRNYKGFDYSSYLKQLNIYGTIECDKLQLIERKQANKIFQISNTVLNRIIISTKQILNEETSSVLLGLILGYKIDIDEEMQQNFRNASMSHILAVSGMHITYVILGINIILKNIIGKRNSNILSIVVLIFYMFITNFSPSITRAGIMGIMVIFSKIVYRKNDIYTSMSISLFIILIYNPYLIQNLGLKLSYFGVLGIVAFNKSILKFLNNIKIKSKLYKYKIRPKINKSLDKIKEIISVSTSVQLAILPIILYNLNNLNPYLLISNLILSITIGPIVILGFLFIVIILINMKIAKMFSLTIEIGIKILISISKIGKAPFSKIYISTPKIYSIIIYYLLILILFFIYNIYSSKKPNITQVRIRNLIALLKIKLRINKDIVKKIIISIILILVVIKLYPKDLKINFIDVGQGDSCLIITPQNKTILIDGGGSMNSDFNVGKNTLIPYILDRGFTKIDIVIISHFDNDHIRRDIDFIRRIESKKSLYIKTGTKF